MKGFRLRMLAAAAAVWAAGSAAGLRIAVLSDIHVSPGNDNALMLREAVREINAGGYDYAVMNGDLTNEGSNAELAFVKGILDEIAIPLYAIPGNHENNWSQSATAAFPRLWGADRFALCTEDADGYVYASVGVNCGPYMKMGDGHVKQEDLHWLGHTLDSLQAVHGLRLRVISFNHYPVRENDLDNWAEYARLLSRYPVAVHINGHYHRPDTYTIGDIGAATVRSLALDGTWGYSVVEACGDEARVYEKPLGGEPRQMCAYTLGSEGHRFEAPVPAPPAVGARCVWRDSASVFTRLGFSQHCVYFGTSTGMAKAVDKRSGEPVWEVPAGTALFSRPVPTGGGRVAIPRSDGIPYVADGIVADSLYIQGGYGRMECRRASDLEILWVYDSIGNYCQGAPVLDGNDLIFGAWDTYLRCIDVRDGSLRWKWSNGKRANLLSPGNVVPAVTPDKVIIVAPDRYMTAIDRRTGRTLWRDNSHRYRESMGQSEDGRTVYAKTMDGELVAVDATAEGFSELWVCDMGLGYEHAPCVVAEKDGVVYAGSRRGIVTAVSADTHRVLWQARLGTSEVNGIDIDPTDGGVWVSLVEGTIWQIAPPPADSARSPHPAQR